MSTVRASISLMIMKSDFLAVGVGILMLFIAGVRTQEVEDEHKFTYSAGPKGPENWGALKVEWRDCGNGKQQSPIDIVEKRAKFNPNLQMIRRRYRPANATLVNRGHDIMLKWGAGGGTILIDGKQYRLQQCHWHTPAEHTLHGKRYPLEMHLLHQSNQTEFAAVGILYDYGKPDPFLGELAKTIQTLTNLTPPEEAVGMVDPRNIIVGTRKYYRYGGSLTTPPCTEGVIWNIVKKVGSVSEEQVRLLHQAIHDENEMNSRPIQPTNGRIVQIFSPQHKPTNTPA